MSKSYDNTIPLFASSKELKAAIARIVTDSRLPGEAKEPDSAHLYTLYKAFATAQQSGQLAADLRAGLAWGEAKQQLFELLEGQLAEPRERYHELLARPRELEDILQDGARRARAIATPFLAELREAVGLRNFAQVALVDDKDKKAKKAKKSVRVVSFRDDAGFRFRVLNAAGEDVLLSAAFTDGRAAGLVMKALQAGELELRVADFKVQVLQDGKLVAESPEQVDAAACQQVLEAIRELSAE